MDSKNKDRYEYISSFLKELRLNSGLTQDELSKSTGLDRKTIISAESEGRLKLDTLFTIIDSLEIPLSELFLELE
jgi:DNA-binding XRE family transcriptional regulator